jgi:uncharacterized repeat protein (TIGR03803 family)
MRHAVLSAALCSLVLVVTSQAASASSMKGIYSFCTQADCTDGAGPGGLVQDASGRFYGVTTGGGAYGEGAVFALIPNADKTKWTETLLYSFCPKAGCRDGRSPQGTLVLDAQGGLYGVMASDANTPGTVFKLVPNAHRTAWHLKKLYRFCSVQHCADGEQINVGLTYAGAASGALYDGVSPLYGVTYAGGANHRGVTFALTPSGTGATEQVLYNFCSAANCADGASPGARLTVQADGSLLGTTINGGTSGGVGTLFRLAPGSGGSWNESVLYAFCAQPDCADGYYPGSAVLVDAAGNMFGAASHGGTNKRGILYKLTPGGTFSVLKNFCDAPKCADGQGPMGDLVMGASGTLYGTTVTGGTVRRGGVAYALGASYTVLYSFCTEAHCRDGAEPMTGVILDASGNLFGTTPSGGKSDPTISAGTIFEITP